MDIYYPELLTNTEAFPAHIHFSFFERTSTTSSSPADNVHLYMPEKFGQPNTISWEELRGGEMLKGAASGIMSAISNMNSVSDKVKNAITRFQNMSSSPATDLAQITTGGLLNPYLAQMFKGVDFRSFQYTFRLVPFSVGDCDTIQNIVRIFRKWALPSGPLGGANSPYLEYPGEVEIRYMFLGGENKYIHRFKRSVITNIDIDYTGAGMWAMMRNGFPAETVMNLSFTEIQVVVREDVEENF